MAGEMGTDIITMVYKVADNIFSPLGETTEVNYKTIRRGESRLRLHERRFGVPEPFMASLFDDGVRRDAAEDGVPFFEYIAVESVRRAVEESGIDVSGENVVLILSTTKGDVAELESLEETSNEGGDNDFRAIRYYYPGAAAKRIAERVGLRTMPIVVCNACVSGLSAIILAQRLLNHGSYDYAIVCGADVMDRFIVSGFQSLKILSEKACRPFDIDRNGLNLGEAAATIILSNRGEYSGGWEIEKGVVRNDATHISTPSTKGDGLYAALTQLIENCEPQEFAVISAHGTGTLFNDRMEAAAIRRAGLSDVPVNGLKGWFGHTMGACGVLETVLTMRALEDGVVLGTKGFGELGVSSKIDVVTHERILPRSDFGIEGLAVPVPQDFIKTLSGFGGCNAAISASKTPSRFDSLEFDKSSILVPERLWHLHGVTITPESAAVDEQRLETEGVGDDMLVNLYRRYVKDYPKFYKMDGLSRLGFIASELLLSRKEIIGETRFVPREDRAIVFFNRSSSVSADRRYLDTIRGDDYYPSPSVFVYTLPNIVTGEIAIRNHYHGETAFYILPERDDGLIWTILATLKDDEKTRSVLFGWLDYENVSHFTAEVGIYDFY